MPLRTRIRLRPTALKKIVDDVVNEKLEDGQFDDCDLTFGELNKVKDALIEALVSHYHHRITYPNFPGGEVDGAGADAPAVESAELEDAD